VNIDYSQEAPTVAGRLTLAQIEELVAKPMSTKPDKKFLSRFQSLYHFY